VPERLLDWQSDGLARATVRSELERGPAVLAISGIPSARLVRPVKAVELLAGRDCPETVRGLREALDSAAEPGVEPEELWALGAELGYDARVLWPENHGAGRYDVWFTAVADPEAAPRLFAFPGRDSARDQLWSSYANDPLRGMAAQKMVPLLRRYLQEQLPEYMAPSALVLLDELPMTSGGKVDRRALPPPDPQRAETVSGYVAPRTPVEERLTKIWSEVLGVRQIGIHENFFGELGGHSLLATQLVSRLRDAFGVDLPLRRLFESPTITQLAVVIEALLIEEIAGLSDEEARSMTAGQPAN
jgi:acyl carrier protein